MFLFLFFLATNTFDGLPEKYIVTHFKKINMDKRRVVKSLIHKLNVDIICLQETKLEGGVRERIKEIWGG